MKSTDNRLLFSATDLSNFLACGHVTLLDRAVQVDGMGKPPRFDDPGLEVLQQRGQEHEQRYLGALHDEGRPGIGDEGTPARLEVPTVAAERARTSPVD